MLYQRLYNRPHDEQAHGHSCHGEIGTHPWSTPDRPRSFSATSPSSLYFIGICVNSCKKAGLFCNSAIADSKCRQRRPPPVQTKAVASPVTFRPRTAGKAAP